MYALPVDFVCCEQPQKAGFADLLLLDWYCLYQVEFVDSFNLCQGGRLLIRREGYIPRLAKVFLTIRENPYDKGLYKTSGFALCHQILKASRR